jgi:hypothetical protein
MALQAGTIRSWPLVVFYTLAVSFPAGVDGLRVYKAEGFYGCLLREQLGYL